MDFLKNLMNKISIKLLLQMCLGITIALAMSFQPWWSLLHDGELSFETNREFAVFALYTLVAFFGVVGIDKFICGFQKLIRCVFQKWTDSLSAKQKQKDTKEKNLHFFKKQSSFANEIYLQAVKNENAVQQVVITEQNFNLERQLEEMEICEHLEIIPHSKKEIVKHNTVYQYKRYTIDVILNIDFYKIVKSYYDNGWILQDNKENEQ